MYSRVKLYFENNGQDYLQWTVQNGVVIKSLPDTSKRWFGVKVDENAVYLGNNITVIDHQNDVVVIPHKIEDIIRVK